jgi:hypothetical protein
MKDEGAMPQRIDLTEGNEENEANTRAWERESFTKDKG